MSDTDEELMVKFKAGDANAFQLLVSRHAASISYFVGRMMPHAIAVEDAEDILQETFFRLWQHRHRWKPKKSSLSTWLHTISRNLCIDHLRKYQKLDDETFDDKETGGSDDDQMAARMETMEVTERIKTSIAALPERQRTALILCHYQGLSNREAADVLDISIDALESLLARARRKLKSQLLSIAEIQNEPGKI